MSEIEAQLSDGDIEILEKYIKKITSPNCYVEIGTAEGGSAMLARKANFGIDIYTIDHQNIHKIEPDAGINFIKGLSLDVVKDWNKPIGVLFIDGDHNDAGKDFEAWEKYVVKGGMILFHDYAKHSPEVIKDCKKIAKRKDYKVLFTPIWGETPTGIFQIRKL